MLAKAIAFASIIEFFLKLFELELVSSRNHEYTVLVVFTVILVDFSQTKLITGIEHPVLTCFVGYTKGNGDIY
jgi:hypothetical protein